MSAARAALGLDEVNEEICDSIIFSSPQLRQLKFQLALKLALLSDLPLNASPNMIAFQQGEIKALSDLINESIMAAKRAAEEV